LFFLWQQEDFWKLILAGLGWLLRAGVGGDVGGQLVDKGEQKVPECFLLVQLLVE
jgi:hypothetical protein